MKSVESPKLTDVAVTRPASWLGLALFGFVLGAAVLWGFFGSVDRTVTGEGVIVRDHRFGIMDIESIASGPIKDIAVEVGETVRVGDTVAVLDLALSREQIQSAEAALESLIAQDARMAADEAERMSMLKKKSENQVQLFERGLITKDAVFRTKAEIEDIQNRATVRKLQIERQRGLLAEKRLREQQDSALRSEHEGRVTEIVGVEGGFINAGRAVVRLESQDGPLEALVFLPAHEGKKVRPGMSVRIAPSTVRPEEHGYLTARVSRVSSFPVTRENVIREIRNDRLADRLLRDGAAIEVIVTPDFDADSRSGFRWTLGDGPDTPIASGTLCHATVVLYRERPVTLVIPFLRRFFPPMH
ncbi:MAG: NHLP bacteriocin system secretion protein [Terrimicrobiaceae bacterium]|nr:NHLP bacteriocin system secretion protein [Terrimicrobiaceae bacterium]